MSSALPPCFAFYGKPATNRGPCSGCAYAASCRNVIPVSELSRILQKLEAIEAKLGRAIG